MGKKAKNDHTPGQLPLDDDVCWMPLLESVTQVINRTGSKKVAIPRLEKKMATSNLPSMCQDLTTDKRKRLRPKFWNANIIYYEEKEPSYVRVIPKNEQPRWNRWASDPADDDGGYFYFVSRSHFDRLFPSPQQARHADAVPPETRSAPPAKPGTKPRDDWPTKVGAWLILKASEDPRRLKNIDALVSGAQEHLQEEIGWAPENTGRIRTQILDFLQLIRR